MGKHLHILSEINESERTAICAECGPVSVRRHNGNGWRCNGGAKKWDGNGRRRGSSHEYSRFKKDYCERKGCVSIIEHSCQLDVHHLDGDPTNNLPDNLMTLCANCHRLVTFGGLSVM